ncbi:hypothetical protein H0Z60_12385 [Ectothiorhodospiraceae bacterium WFHF3C12]|nr:hypothetical protein [Ectothiorhodospiraceae bacterium WFHF3C12]
MTFYADLVRWPGRGRIELSPVSILDALDRGPAWDRFLHHLSEHLISVRGGAVGEGPLVFGRSLHSFDGLDIRRRHHLSVKLKADEIIDEFDQADEWISDSQARESAYAEGVEQPSAYDLVLLSNFLTSTSMTELFETELRRLGRSLTPGGVLIVLGGTGGDYPEIYSRLRAACTSERLKDISPPEPMQAGANYEYLALVAKHTRGVVELAFFECPPEIQAAASKQLPEDLVNDNERYRLPRFRVLVHVKQGPPRQKRRENK